MDSRSLDHSVLVTLAYFDVFDYPLTTFEVWKLLYAPAVKASVSDVAVAVDSLTKSGRIELKDGFAFLPSRSSTVETRLRRSVIAERKFRRARWFVRLLRFSPFVRTICVCNTLAYGNARPESDIDFFLLVEPGRVWTARFFPTAFLKLFGLRPSGTVTSDRLCLAFFLGSREPSIASLKIDDRDPYLTFWVSQLVPMYDEGAFASFWGANDWVRRVLPNAFPYDPAPRRRVRRLGAGKRLLEAFVKIVPEKFFRSIQERILPANLRDLANRDTRVVLNDTMLKFHDTDRRAAYEEAFTERLARLGVSV